MAAAAGWDALYKDRRGKSNLPVSNNDMIQWKRCHHQMTVRHKLLGFGPKRERHNSLPGDIERVGRLMESYLAEIASDHNLTIARFISLADLIPEQSRVIEDGMYRDVTGAESAR